MLPSIFDLGQHFIFTKFRSKIFNNDLKASYYFYHEFDYEYMTSLYHCAHSIFSHTAMSMQHQVDHLITQ